MQKHLEILKNLKFLKYVFQSWNLEILKSWIKFKSWNSKLLQSWIQFKILKSWNLEILNISKSWNRLSPDLTGVQYLEILKSWNLEIDRKSWNTIGSSSKILKYTDNSRLDFRILKSWNLEILNYGIQDWILNLEILKSWNTSFVLCWTTVASG